MHSPLCLQSTAKVLEARVAPPRPVTESAGGSLKAWQCPFCCHKTIVSSASTQEFSETFSLTPALMAASGWAQVGLDSPCLTQPRGGAGAKKCSGTSPRGAAWTNGDGSCRVCFSYLDDSRGVYTAPPRSHRIGLPLSDRLIPCPWIDFPHFTHLRSDPRADHFPK